MTRQIDKNKPTSEFLTGPQVYARYQKTQVTIYRWIRDPDLGFPKPIQIKNMNYWRLSDLETWENKQQALGAAA